jgi:hypothetical protein
MVLVPVFNFNKCALCTHVSTNQIIQSTAVGAHGELYREGWVHYNAIESIGTRMVLVQSTESCQRAVSAHGLQFPAAMRVEYVVMQ